MIRESHPWKQDLARTATYFLKLQSAIKLRYSQHLGIEKRAFFAFYAIRKLIEARKLSDQVTSLLVPVKIYPPTGKSVTHHNWHRSEEHFHLDQPRSDTLGLLLLCRQFVHSHVFHIVENEEGGFGGLMVASDHQRKKGLLHLDVAEIVCLFHSVASDDVVWSKWEKDPDTGKETFILSNVRLPSEWNG